MARVVIVGAGPGGSAAAIHLARAGHDVVVLERSRHAQRKPCGEGLFPAGVRELRTLGVDPVRDLGGRPIAQVRFHAGAATAAAKIGTPDAPAVGVHRGRLAGALLRALGESGIAVRNGVSVEGITTRAGRVVALETSAGPYEADAFVAADGLRSRLRRLAGLDASPPPRRWGVSAHVDLPVTAEPAVDVFFRVRHEIYVGPVAARSVNVAVLMGGGLIRGLAGDVEARFRALVRDLPALSAGFTLIDRPLVSGPAPARCSRAWRANLALTGDAAGFYDGISGEGMSAALVSARLCATAMDEFLRTGSFAPLREYDRRRRAITRNPDLLARLSLLLGSNERLAELAVRNLARQPGTFEKLIATNSGESRLADLRPRDLFALATGC